MVCLPVSPPHDCGIGLLRRRLRRLSGQISLDLLRTGVGTSGRDLGLMKMISVQALQALSDDEIAQIQAYLTAEAAKAPAQ